MLMYCKHNTVHTEKPMHFLASRPRINIAKEQKGAVPSVNLFNFYVIDLVLAGLPYLMRCNS